MKKLKNLISTIKTQKELKDLINFKKSCFKDFSINFEAEKDLAYTLFYVDSLNSNNEIVLDEFHLYMNGKEIAKRQLDLSLYKNQKNCSCLSIRMYSINFLPGDEFTINLKVLDKNLKINYLSFKSIYLHDDEVFLDFS